MNIQWKKDFAELIKPPKYHRRTLASGYVFTTIRYINSQNRIHKIDGPAYFSYEANGTIVEVGYWIEGKKHRIDGPAIITFYEDGSVEGEGYFQWNKCHRESGPAIIHYYPTGKIVYADYYRNGKRISEKY